MGFPSWDITNAVARAHWAQNSRNLEGHSVLALRELRTHGIHQCKASTLLGAEFDLLTVQNEADALLRSPDIQKQIAERRSREGVKWYVVRAFGYKPQRSVPPGIAVLVLNDQILSVVNSYLGLSGRVLYLDLWYNFPVGKNEPSIDSEQWHRDEEDRRLVKLFLYLSDVDESAGPFAYLNRTHSARRDQVAQLHEFPSTNPDGTNEHDENPESPTVVTGPPGTLILFDACGLHRGGRAHGKARVVIVATYGSDAAFDSLRYRLQDEDAALSTNATFAIRASSAKETSPSLTAT